MSLSLSARAALTTVFLMALLTGANFALASSGEPTIVLTVTDKNGNTGSSVQIIEGEEITLHWYGEHVDNCRINPGDIAATDMTSGSTAYEGQLTLTPDSDDADYSISCQGTTDSVSVTPLTTLTLDVDYSSLDIAADGTLSPGEPTISWSAKEVSSCGYIQRTSLGGSTSAYWYDVGSNFTGETKDNDINTADTYQYELRCTGRNGLSITASAVVEVSQLQTTKLSMSVSPKVITADSNGTGKATITWTGENLRYCDTFMYHDSPTQTDKNKMYTSRNTSGSLTIILSESGEHRFRMSCKRGDNGGKIAQTATTELSYSGVTLSESAVTLSADPTNITLTADELGTTRLTWSSTGVRRCSNNLQRKAPSQTKFHTFDSYQIYTPFSGSGEDAYSYRQSAVSGSVLDREISELGTYTYKHTCFSSIDNSEVSDTAVVNVTGDADLVPRVEVNAVPDIITPNTSTGLAEATIVWSHANVFQYECSDLQYRGPEDSSFSSHTSDPQDSSMGTTKKSLFEYGVHEFRLQCDHPTTGSDVESIATVEVQVGDPLLTPNLTLNTAQVNNSIEVEFSNEHYQFCRGIERKAQGSDDWTTLVDGESVHANMTKTFVDSDVQTEGEYLYRTSCLRRIEGRNDKVEAQQTYQKQTVTGNASVEFGQCRNDAGEVVSVPAGYKAVGGYCVLNRILGEIKLTVDSQFIQSGDTAEINWEYDGTYVFDECLLQGPGLIDPNTGNAANSVSVSVSAGLTGSTQTNPLYSASRYRLTCTASDLAEPLVSEIGVEVIPTYQEL